MRQTQLTEACRRGGVDFSTSVFTSVARTVPCFAPGSVDQLRHCERSEAIQRSMPTAPGLLRRFAPRNDEQSRSRDALRTRVFFQAYGKTPAVERNGAPGGARVVGHATRTSVTTRSRFGRGARHRSIRSREPPASGALRLPALHRHEYESFRPSDWLWPAANL
jgi:hypothetical protein